MPSWGEILLEVNAELVPPGVPNYDAVRRRYLQALADLTGRSTIVYASAFLNASAPPNLVTIDLVDMQAMMEMLKDLPGPNLDLVLHTPGGSPEALESVVRYLRTKFTHIRAFIPLAAMSAGTMWALACDEIVMGKHSQLGPIDPQFALAFGEQIRLTPAQAVLDQFELAKDECKDNVSLPWAVILRSYGPSLLEECRRAQRLSYELVSAWLRLNMFRDMPNRSRKARAVARRFANYRRHHSHARAIGRDEARSYGVPIANLEDDEALQDAVLSVHHATMLTLSGTPTAKIVENNLPRTFVLTAAQQILLQQMPPPGQPPTG